MYLKQFRFKSSFSKDMLPNSAKGWYLAHAHNRSYDHGQAWPHLQRNRFFCDVESPRTSRIIFLSSPDYNIEEMIFASVNVQGGVQPMRAQVLQNREAQSSAAVQANDHVIDMYDDGEDFGFYPNFFEFD